MIDVRMVSEGVRAAKHPEDVFGEKATHDSLASDFRQLAAALHPDRHGASKDAHELFVKLGQLRSKAVAKLAAGTYGQRSAPAPAPAAPPEELDVVVKGKQYRVKGRAYAGDICDLYACQHDGQDVLFKLAQSAAENDLVENEARVLAHLFPKDAKEEKFYRYLPRALDAFMLKGKTTRKVVVLPWFKEHHSLEQVRAAFPHGLDFRDAVWMFKRTLAGLGFAHRQGVVHGSIIPPHVLIHPVEHGAKLVDWCNAVHGTGRVKSVSSRYRAFYAPEILAKLQPNAATDIFMAAKCFVHLVGGDVASGALPGAVPRELQAFMRSCLIDAPRRRPDDAWGLHEEFDDLLRRVVGKRAYRPLEMPEVKP